MATRKSNNRVSNTRTKKKTTQGKNAAAKTTSKASVKPKAKLSRKISFTPSLVHKLSIVTSVVLAVLTVALMSPVVFPLTLGYLTSDALLSKTETVFVPAQRVQFDLEIRWVLVGLLAFSALYSLLLLTRWRSGYEKALAKRVFFWRWVYLGVSSAVLVGVVAILSGVYDLLAVKLIADVTLMAFMFAWLSERQNEKASRPVPSAYLLGLVTAVLPWFMIGGYALATTIYGLVRLPWFVYAAQAAVLIGTLGLFANLWMSHKRQKQWKDYANVERGYLTLSLLTQVAVVVILLVGLAK